MSSNRKQAAIIFTDIVNYTQTMEELVFPIVEQHQGKALKNWATACC